MVLNVTRNSKKLELLNGENWCIFCLKNCENVKFKKPKEEGNVNDDSATNKKNTKNKHYYTILKFLFRHINYSFGDRVVEELERNGFGSESGSCEDCLSLIQEFHEFYKEIKLLEMKINWKVGMLLAIMTTADKATSRSAALKEKNFNGREEQFEELQNLRRILVKLGLAKLRSVHPKIQLKKCDGQEGKNQDQDQEDVVRKLKPDSLQPLVVLHDCVRDSNVGSKPKLKWRSDPEVVKINVQTQTEVTREITEEVVEAQTQTDSYLATPKNREKSEEEIVEAVILDAVIAEVVEPPCGNIEDDNNEMLPYSSSLPPSPAVSFEGDTTLDTSATCDVGEGEIADYEIISYEKIPESPSRSPVKTSDIKSGLDLDQNLNSLLHETIVEDEGAEEAIEEIQENRNELQIETGPEFMAILKEDVIHSQSQPQQKSKSASEFGAPNDFDLVLEESICDSDADADENTQEVLKGSNDNEVDDDDDAEYEPNDFEGDSDEDSDFKVGKPCKPTSVLRRSSRLRGNQSAIGAPIDGIPLKLECNTENNSELQKIMSESISINAEESIAPVPRRKRKRKRGRVTTMTPAPKIAKLDDPVSISDLPNLRQLALNKVLHLRYICNIQPCTTTKFWNIEDIKNHTLHHGRFRCNFCNVVVTYAPDLLKHEIEEHKSQTSESDAKNCSRCEYVAQTESSVKNHFLESHLNLIVDKVSCSICQRTLVPKMIESLPLELMRHFRTHHGLRDEERCTNLCDVPNCRAFFRTPGQLSMHQKSIHIPTPAEAMATLAEVSKKDPPRYRCNRCNKGFRYLTLLSNHKKLNHPQNTKRYKYIRPPKPYNPKDNPRIHNDYSHWFGGVPLSPEAEQLFQSPIQRCGKPNCKKYFFTDAELQTHLKLHGGFKCNFCDEVFDYAGKLPVHETKHVNVEECGDDVCRAKFSCARCPFTATLQRRFVIHYLEAHLNLPVDYVSCPICKNEFYTTDSKRKYRESYISHMKETHDFSKTIFKCEEEGCLAYFNTKFQRTIHQNDHKVNVKIVGGRRMYECSKCGKLITNRDSLLEHYDKAHVGVLERNPEEQWICHECGKSVKTEQGLNLHYQQVHGDRIPEPKPKMTFFCEICGKQCKDSGKLKLHLLIHAGPESWKFECPTCGKRCINNPKLLEHQRTHTNEKPFSCEHCGLRYAHRHNLRIHINSKHSDIACDIPRKFDKSGLVSSRKGIKLKKATEEQIKTQSKRKGRPRKKRKDSSTSIDSDSNFK